MLTPLTSMLPASIGPYRIVRLLGEGGMGVVYEARQESLDRRVALKTLHPEYARQQEQVSRFFNEAKVLSKLEHPSIVQVSDFGTTNEGTVYLVMEFLRGESLRHRLSTITDHGDRLPIAQVLQIAWQVADVLAVAHAMGIVHRDLKPDNLMLVSDPVAPGGERVKLLDFGIAKLTKERDRNGLKTDTQAVMGTPAYMSPEQCAGAGGVDAKSDVYSLGCVLYEALSGQTPFVADGTGRIIAMHLFQEPVSLQSIAPKVPTVVAELVHRLLVKDKRLRPNMSDTADDLGKLLSKLSGAGPVVRSYAPNSTDPDSTRVVRSHSGTTTLGDSIGQNQGATHRWKRVVFSAALVTLVTAGGLLWRTIHSAQPSTKSTSQQFVQSAPMDNALSRPGAAVIGRGVSSDRKVKWLITTEPAGAAVLAEDGTLLGNTPWRAELTPQTGIRLIRLRRDGFAENTLELDESTDAQLSVRMVRLSVSNPALQKSRPSPPKVQPPSAKQEKRSGLSYED